MMFPGDAPRAVEVMAATASSSSPPSPPPHRPLVLRGKPRSRHHPVPHLRAAAWANQRLLRCVRVDGDGDTPAVTAPPAPATAAERKSPVAGTRNDGFERIRAKLMDHLREAVGRIELPAASSSSSAGEPKWNQPATSPVKEAADDEDEHHEAPPASSSRAQTVSDNPMFVAAMPAASVPSAPTTAGEDLPWNLRTRKSLAASCNGRQYDPNVHPGPVSLAASPPAKVTSRLRSGAPERRGSPLRRQRPRFSVPLTKEEIDEDLYAFTGRRASRRPKKRPRVVQKQLDMLFPGLWLFEVTADAYQVAEPPPPPPS